MRKIDELVKQKFWNYDPTEKERLSVNTRIQHNDDYSYLFLFENLITKHDLKSKILYIDFKGYTTKITKNRLNAVLSKINQGINYFKGIPLLNNAIYLPTDRFHKIKY
jgi:hypothetical protein